MKLFDALFLTACTGWVLSSCSAHKMYPGPERPDSDVAIVKGSRTVNGVQIFFLGHDKDGKEIPVLKIELTAGHHEISVQVGDAEGTRYPIVRTIAFEALGGHAYQIKGVEWDKRIWVWIEDTDTGYVVGGEKP